MKATPQHLSVRAYQAEDAAATLRIFTAAITRIAAADYSPEQIRAWAQPGLRDSSAWHLDMHARNSFVATAGGKVVGFSDVDESGHIDMMFVDPDHQRQGVAFSLLVEAERQARGLGAGSLSADVSITARPLFERYGFTVEHRQEAVIREVKLVNFRMRKALDGSRTQAELGV